MDCPRFTRFAQQQIGLGLSLARLWGQFYKTLGCAPQKQDTIKIHKIAVDIHRYTKFD